MDVGHVDDDALEEDPFAAYPHATPAGTATPPTREVPAARGTSWRPRAAMLVVVLLLAGSLYAVTRLGSPPSSSPGGDEPTAAAEVAPPASPTPPAPTSPAPTSGWVPARDLLPPGAPTSTEAPSARPVPVPVPPPAPPLSERVREEPPLPAPVASPEPVAVAPSPAVTTPPVVAAPPPPASGTGSVGVPRERVVPGLPRQMPTWSPGNGLLLVRADVPARVRVDGIDVGSTEGFVPIRLPEGSYRVEVRMGNQVGAMDVNVQAGHSTPAVFRLRSTMTR